MPSLVRPEPVLAGRRGQHGPATEIGVKTSFYRAWPCANSRVRGPGGSSRLAAGMVRDVGRSPQGRPGGQLGGLRLRCKGIPTAM